MTFMEITQTVPEHLYLVWGNVFFYLFIVSMIVYGIVGLLIMNVLKKRGKAGDLMQQRHVARIDIIRKEHTDKLESLRVEMLKREEERSRQWMESEKETLHVLNGVSTLLDLSEKIGRVESEKILKKLGEIQEKVEKIPKTEEKSES